MSRRPIEFKLAPEDRKAIGELLQTGGLQPVRVILRAIALDRLAAGATAPAVAEVVRFSSQAVRRIAHRYLNGGLDQALFEREGKRGAKERLQPAQKQRIIAMVCAAPPAGQARWTIRLIAEEAIKRKLAPRVGRETIRVLLNSHDTKPWREKNVVYPTPRRRIPGANGGRAGAV